MLYKVRKIRGKDSYKIYNVLTKKTISTHETKQEADHKVVIIEQKEEHRKLIEKLLIDFDGYDEKIDDVDNTKKIIDPTSANN